MTLTNPDVSEQVIDLLAELVRFPTVSRQSNRALQEWLADRLEAAGASITMVAGDDPERTNLLATLGPERAGGLILSGHTDVVDPGEGWATDPWTLVPVGNKLYGRGSADMKGFLAAVLVAIDGLDVNDLMSPIRIVASYDEEIGCQGVREVLPVLTRDEHIRPDLVVIGEPTMMTARHSHMGKEVHRLTVRSAEAHSSQWATAPSAIAHGAELLRTLGAIQQACPASGSGEPSGYSINCGTVRGGTQPNVIAANFEVTFEIRHGVEHDPADVLAPLDETIEEIERELAAVDGGVDRELLTSYPAMATDPSLPAYRRAERLVDNGPSSGLAYGTEGGLFATALDSPIMICGPGDIADAHRCDEFVTTEQLERCVRFVRTAIDEFCVTNNERT